MKQRLLLFLASLMMVFGMSAEDTGNLGLLQGGRNSVEIADLGNGMFLVSVTGGDPYCMMTPIDMDLTKDQNTVKFDYKLNTDLGGGVEFFFSPIAGGRELQFTLEPTDEWKSAQINIAAAKENFTWGKEGDQLRFDFGNSGTGVIQLRNIRIGAYEPPVLSDLQQDADGTCVLSSPKDIETYAGYVNSGMMLNARLAKDIDYTGHMTFMGTSQNNFMGNFDGQGHTITVGYETTDEWQCLFPYFAGTVKNLVVKGDIKTAHPHEAGLIGRSFGGYVQNCVSQVNITSTLGEQKNAAYGGFICDHASAYLYMDNCIYMGTISAPEAENAGGLVGWSSGRTTLTACVMAGNIADVGGETNYILARNPGTVTVKGCSYTQKDALANSGATLIELGNDGLASGELAYMANLAAGTTAFYQTLGQDAFPVPFSTHSVVYAKGDVRCDGQPMGGNISYTNDASAAPSHQFVDGFCTVCGGVDKNFVPEIDGVFQVGTPAQLVWLSKYVGLGNRADAVLTNDLDMTGIDFEPIGSDARRFTGTFDGQMHRISNLSVNRPEQQGVGLFGTVAGTVVVRNLILDETCSIVGKSYAGVVGCAKTSANVTISCVGNEGSVTVSEQNGGGIFGCNDGNCALLTMRNCYVTGKIKSGREGAALSGWAYGAAISGCWSTAEVEGADGPGTSFFRGSASATNCYTTHGQCSAITVEDASTGKLAYLLNGGLKANMVWYQTIGSDNHPVYDRTHGMVYKVGEEYADIHDAESLKEYKERLLAEARNYILDLVATDTLVAAYEAEIEVMAGLNTLDEVIGELDSLEAGRKAVEASAAAFAAYKQKVDETLAYLDSNNEFEGEYRERLSDYLVSDEEPGETYANGGADYIYNTHKLGTEDVKAETANIDQMLADAIKYGYKTGSEVTDLLVNANLADGVNGWEGASKLNGTIKSNTQEMYSGEYYGSGAFDMYQKLEGLRNGVYVLAANAAARPFNDRYSMYYNASLYMNEDNVLVPTSYETRLPKDEAQDGVNCYLTATNAGDAAVDLEIMDSENNLLAYAMHGRTSMANAAAAGRAQNYLITQVTDGVLTLGYRKLAATSGSDWAGLSNLHLYYFATMDEAESYLDKVLACQVARADSICNFEFDLVDFVVKPNCPQSIKDALQKAVADVKAATDVQQKYALVQTFSTLFTQYTEGRAAYVALAKEAEAISLVVSELHAAGKLEETEADKISTVTEDMWSVFENGTFSTEEAQAMTALRATGVIPNVNDGVCEIESNLQMAYYTQRINQDDRLDARLMADIDYFSASQMMNNFYGVLDGNHHSITLDINTQDDASGLIRDLQGGTVKDLTILGTISTVGKFAAAVAGRTSSGTSTISGVASYVNIESSVAGDGTHGGIVGVVNAALNLSNSLFAGSIKGSSTNSCGGLVGWSSAACKINNCLQIGSMEVDPSGGCTFSRNMSAVTVTNSYYLNAHGDSPAGVVTAEQLASGEVCYKLNSGLDINPAWRQTLGEDTYPVLDPTHKVVGKAADGTYSNEALSEMARHKGTADDPYPLGTLAELQAMRRCMTPGKTTYFVLSNDIDMKGVKNWAILNDQGDVADGKNYRNYINFDGKGHVIKNFAASTGNYPSFFGVLCGEVRNVGFENASVTSMATGSGILCSHSSHPNYTDAEGNMLTSTIENVWVTGDITGTKSYCGALIGRVYGPTVVKNCYVNAQVTSTVEATGALAARVTAPFRVENFYAAGKITEGKGLVGTVSGKADEDVATYRNIVVWNNTDNIFGAQADNDVLTGISYYDGTNFAELQKTVVGWDSKTWSCTMEEGAYPVLTGLADGIGAVATSPVKGTSDAIYNLNGQRVQRVQKGIYIIGGRKVLVK